MNEPPILYGLVLTGGDSSRMGQDKALLLYHSQPQYKICVQLLSGITQCVFVSKRPAQNFPPSPPAVFINDLPAYCDKGPLAGILSAMKQYPNAAWLVLACDLPFMDIRTLEQLIAKRNPEKHATAYFNPRHQSPEPLCAIYEPSILPLLQESIQSGIHCPRKILMRADVELLEATSTKPFENINTSQEYEQRAGLNHSKKFCSH